MRPREGIIRAITEAFPELTNEQITEIDSHGGEHNTIIIAFSNVLKRLVDVVRPVKQLSEFSDDEFRQELKRRVAVPHQHDWYEIEFISIEGARTKAVCLTRESDVFPMTRGAAAPVSSAKDVELGLKREDAAQPTIQLSDFSESAVSQATTRQRQALEQTAKAITHAICGDPEDAATDLSFSSNDVDNALRYSVEAARRDIAEALNAKCLDVKINDDGSVSVQPRQYPSRIEVTLGFQLSPDVIETHDCPDCEATTRLVKDLYSDAMCCQRCGRKSR